MALDELAATIETIKERIVGHRTSLAANETRTRQVLIDPLLAALGWDVSDPEHVELEYDVRGKRADYALKSNGQVVAVIEAKSLERPLEERETRQALTYANESAIAYMAVTDGDIWRMYDVFAAKPIEDRIIMEFSISRTPTHESALRSLSMWCANLSSGSVPTAASEPILVSPGTQVPSQRNPGTEPLADTNTDKLGEDWCSISSLSVQKGDRPPTETRIGSNLVELSPYNNWTGFFVGFAKWLVTSSKLGSANCPVFLHEKSGLYLVNVTPRQPKGKEFDAKQEIGGGLWIEKNLDTPGKKRSLTHLLQHCGIDPNSVLVKVD